MKLLFKIGIIGLLVGVLAGIRLYEYRFFYDPFMYFFEQAFEPGNQLDFKPEMFFNLAIRFLLNTLISLLILYVAFRKKGIVKFSALVFGLFFLLLFPTFVYLMEHIQPDDYMAAFYVRRFLAHPVLILVLLPAFFYYQLREDQEKGSISGN